MAFQTALSGLNAAQANLDVTSNNIANSSTHGFKGSRALFSDVFASSYLGSSQTEIGAGVRLTDVQQQFTQGNVEFTDNNLDLAISGQGFFALRDDEGFKYTRAGAFSVDKEGYVVNSHGQHLQVYGTDDEGTVNNTTLMDNGSTDLQLNTGTSAAQASSSIDLKLNLEANATVEQPGAIDSSDADTYNFTTSSTIYDSLGSTHTATMYFQKAPSTTELGLSGSILATGGAAAALAPVSTTVYDAEGTSYPATITFQETGADTWNATIDLNGGAITQTATLDFSTSPTTVANNTISGVDLGATGRPADLTVDFSSITQSATTTTANVADRTDDGPANSWNVMMEIDGQQFDTEELTFTSSGELANANPIIDFTDGTGAFTPPNSDPITMEVDFTGSSQFGGDSVVQSMSQDGYTFGKLSSIDVDLSGVVYARYTNGQAEPLGAVALVNFANPHALQEVGETNWVQTMAAGERVEGQANTGSFGGIHSGALESSNVDLSKELVEMIVAQRDYQANAKMISTEDQVTQTIMNIR